MGQIVYMLAVKVPSRKAKKMYGYGWTWPVRAKFRMRLPESERDLHRLFLPYVKYDIPCMVKLIRNNAKGEDKGFKAVVYGHMTSRSFEIIRRARAWNKATSLSTHKPIPTIGDHSMSWCYDAETEVLTANGWRKFSEIMSSDQIATLNERQEVEYHVPIDTQKFWYEGEMIRFRGRSYDLLVTPNHQMYVRGIWGSRFGLKSALFLGRLSLAKLRTYELLRSATWIGEDIVAVKLPELQPTVGMVRQMELHDEALLLISNGASIANVMENLGVPRMTLYHWRKDGVDPRNRQMYARSCKEIPIDSWLDLLAWYLSEGSVDNTLRSDNPRCDPRECARVVKIDQKSEFKTKEICDAIERAGFVPHIGKYRNNYSVRILSAQLARYLNKFGHSYEKFIPRSILALPPARLRPFLRTLLKGDGNGTESYYTSSERLANDVQELALKCGYGATLTKNTSRIGRIRSIGSRQIRTCHPEYSISIAYKQLTPRIGSVPVRVHYEGYVYDVTVPNHLIMVRRNGRAIWSSNSRQPEWSKPPLDQRLQGIPRNRFRHGPFSGRIKD